MKNLRVLAMFLSLGVLGVAGCTNNGMVTPPTVPGSAQVSLSVTDTAPVGVTVLSFEVTVTSAVLNPGNVQLVGTPTRIEVKRLETESAFLNAIGVAAGTYNSITINLANPELTILNQSGSTFTVGGVVCGTGTVCELKPAVAGAITFSGSPFPVTIVANTPIGFLVDFNLNNIITTGASVDFTVANALTITQLVPSAGQLRLIDDLHGIVSNKDTANNQFTLQTLRGSVTIKVDSNTRFEDFDDSSTPCTANPQNFTCVVNGQFVEVSAGLLTAGTLLARKVELEDEPNQEQAEGIIVRIGSGTPPTQFDIAVIGESSPGSTIQLGNVVRVQLLSSASFSVGDTTLNFGGLPFASALDLMVGQNVRLRVRTFTPGTPPVVTTDRVRLARTRFTAQVTGTPSGSNFNVTSLPSLFTANGVTQIQVRTFSGTDFDGVSGVSGLATGNTVSVRGLLFPNAGSPVLEADKVRKR
jgi:uncharacterized protein DUF5666